MLITRAFETKFKLICPAPISPVSISLRTILRGASSLGNSQFAPVRPAFLLAGDLEALQEAPGRPRNTQFKVAATGTGNALHSFRILGGSSCDPFQSFFPCC